MLFAEFADSSTDTSQNHVRDKTAIIQRFFNDYDLSLRNYMDTISYGQFQVQNYFPQQDGNGTPVGGWDIMASTSYFLQYPLAYFRSAVSGWISIPEVTADQQGCTLYAPTTSGYEHRNEQALILRTPYSDKEFFVVEYRRQGTKYTSELEQRIPGTGLIIYRVNTNRQSNTQGGTDMVYVFRPGDTFDSTGVECGAGDLSAYYLHYIQYGIREGRTGAAR